MAASELRVQPQDAHAHDVKGATDRKAAAMFRRLDKNFITNSRAHHRERFTPKLNRLSLCGPQRSPHAVSRAKFNSGERGRSAGLMRPRDPRADVEGFEFDGYQSSYLAGR